MHVALGRAGRRAKDQVGWPRSFLRVEFFSGNPPQWNSQYLEGLTKSTIPAGCWPTRAQCILHFTVHLPIIFTGESTFLRRPRAHQLDVHHCGELLVLGLALLRNPVA